MERPDEPKEEPKLTEIELRNKWIKEAGEQTIETLPAWLKGLSEYPHDYGTICRAIAAAGLGAMNALERGPSGGISGAQAGFIIWDVIDGWGVFGDGPMRMQCFDNLMYPQHANKFNAIPESSWKRVVDKAKKKLEEGSKDMAERVRLHMEKVAEGIPPFGLQITEDE